MSWVVIESTFMGIFYVIDKREKGKIILTLKQHMSVDEYRVKFTKQSCYLTEMVAYRRCKTSNFFTRLNHMSSKKGKAMDIAIVMVNMQQVKEGNLRDREEFRNKKYKTTNKPGKKTNNTNQSSFNYK